MKKEKSNNLSLLEIIPCIIAVIILFLLFTFTTTDNRYLRNKLAFYENESMREATIISVTDCCVYVYDDYINKVIEIDISDELIHTTIEVGDTALYGVDYNYTDADLIGIIKRK